MYFRKSFNGLLTLAVRVNKTAILTLVKNTSKKYHCDCTVIQTASTSLQCLN